MIWEFDTGAGVAVDTLIQRATIALLEPLRYVADDPATARGPYLRTLQGIPSSFTDPDHMEEQRSEWMTVLPAALVYVGDGVEADNPSSGRDLMQQRDVWVYVVSGVASDMLAGRTDEFDKDTPDSRDDPGVRVIKQHVSELLHGNHPLDGLGVRLSGSKSFQWRGDMELLTKSDWSAWLVRCTLDINVTQCAADTRVAPDVDLIRANHDLFDKGTLFSQETDLS